MKTVISRQYIVDRKKYGLFLFAFLLFTIYCLLPTTAFAQAPTEYQLLAPLPNISTKADGSKCVKDDKPCATANTFLPGLIKLIIALAGGLAVVMIVYGGIQYMSTDAFSGKSEAKDTIEHALWGLMLAISAWLILNTINPKLVEINLDIPKQEIATSTVPGGDTGGGGRNTGCQGNCPYSYVNSSGVTVRYRDCFSCSNASSFGLSIKTLSVNGTPAQINTDLGNKLKGIRDTSGSPAFQVTETWPPTVNHASQQQYDGTSVDVSLSNPSVSGITVFSNNARAKGLRVVYEVESAAKRQDYWDAGLPFGVTIIVVPYITGEHFSVYKQ